MDATTSESRRYGPSLNVAINRISQTTASIVLGKTGEAIATPVLDSLPEYADLNPAGISVDLRPFALPNSAALDKPSRPDASADTQGGDLRRHPVC